MDLSAMGAVETSNPSLRLQAIAALVIGVVVGAIVHVAMNYDEITDDCYGWFADTANCHDDTVQLFF